MHEKAEKAPEVTHLEVTAPSMHALEKVLGPR